MQAKLGDRVGAIYQATATKVEFFGYGVYQGRGIPDKSVCGFAAFLAEEGMDNPKILLDSGKVVWGCECWWGPADLVKQKIGDREVVEVDVEEVRLRHKCVPS